jgi:hypothetical protein
MSSETGAQPKPSWLDQFNLGVTEYLFILGWLLLFIGLWLWLGLGQACFGAGSVLIAVALINSIARQAAAERSDHAL